MFGSVAAVVYGLYRHFRGPTYNFRRETVVLLTQFSSGKLDVIYDGATPQFRESIRRERFIEVMKVQREVLGKFVQVVAIEDVEHFDSPGGALGTATMRLLYEGGPAPGSFSYKRVGKVWKLIGFNLSVPKALRETADRALKNIPKSDAPKRVFEAVSKVGTLWAEHKYEDIYAMTSGALQRALTGDEFEHELVSREARLGRFITVLDMPISKQNKDRNRAEVHAILKFENTVTTGDFAFILQKREWRITGFKVQLPGPEIPMKIPPPPGQSSGAAASENR